LNFPTVRGQFKHLLMADSSSSLFHGCLGFCQASVMAVIMITSTI
jgi:hypothetical protein